MKAKSRNVTEENRGKLQEDFLERFLHAENVWQQGRGSARSEKSAAGNCEKHAGQRRERISSMPEKNIQTSAPAPAVQVGSAPKTSRRKSSPVRLLLTLVFLFVLTPLTILAGIWFLGDRKYLFISIMLLLYAMIIVAVRFEGRRPKAREIVTLAALAALAAAGRAVFYMLPGIKPVAAIVIIVGVSFGGETGFLTGALSMLVSDFLFGQGPWTPWQMFAMGLIGLLAGLLFHNRPERQKKTRLCLYGFLAVIFLYGGIMNPASLLIYSTEISWQSLLAIYISGLPMDLLHAGGTVVFLWLGGGVMLEKLDRIHVKYGIFHV